MSNKTKYILFFLFFLSLISRSMYAQFSYPYPWHKGWEIGANVGLSYFYGDVNDNKSRILRSTPLSGFYYEEKRFMFDVSAGKSLTPYLGVKLHFSYGKLSGSNDNLNMYFNGEVFTMDGIVSFNYLDYFLKRPEHSKFKYYAYTGLGFSGYNAVRRRMGTNLFLGGIGYTNNGTERSSLASDLVFKFGLGLGYQFDKQWMANFETSLYYLNADNMDAYNSSNTLLEGFGYYSLGIVYKFNLNIRTKNKMWKSSSGTNNKPHNSGQSNKRKRKLHNKWK